MLPRVLITGADGFIGSHLTELMVRAGYPVRAFAQYQALGSLGWIDQLAPEIQKELEVIRGDIRDARQLEQAVEGCEWVFHLAALISIPYSYLAPSSYLETNVNGTLNILEACKRHGTDRIIVTSTSEVYGTAQYVPIDEQHPLQPQSPYSASKVSSDSFATAYFRTFELPVTIARPFNAYGPRQSTRAIIPTIITRLLAGNEILKLGDLTPTRDLNFVEDTAAAFLAMAQSPQTIGQALNIATGVETSMQELTEMLIELILPSAQIELDRDRIRPSGSEVFRLLGNAQKLRDLTSWAPKFDLRDGLAKTIEWYRQPGHLAYFQQHGNFV
ncbi:GDP-mannose 4,6-dehydratase [Pontibacter sp. G13]|uniref:GDP-mannose 4,6-dehydratase n=1 Tax=Pontibacter sp. G13 TaxID=3074898 RepID=UPI00288A6767|nr:GDP-mannose 4,6-dehydratase [Pontibacter sp. G13]WNJ19265.1 GDP-mannose 4,6-dehydratase [Pontibacter sp. G13]